jgi:hypothetical protein
VDTDERHRPLADLVQEGLALQHQLNISGGQGPLSLPEAQIARRHWQDAVIMQSTLSHQSGEVAERVVVSALNQMLRLARVTSWWESCAGAAIAETVDYASGNDAVDSVPAQRAWDRYWALRSHLGKFGPEMGLWESQELQALTDRLARAEAEWLAAWDLWAVARS